MGRIGRSYPRFTALESAARAPGRSVRRSPRAAALAALLAVLGLFLWLTSR